MNNYIALSSLAMDLKRASNGFYRGTDKTAQRFWKEALKRKAEVDMSLVAPYVSDLLNSMENIVNSEDKRKVAEDLLLYSILFQNASLKLK